MITDVMLTMEINRLIERCRQGDADALGELYKAYATRMRGVCRRYISDEQTVNDVLHDAFVIIFTSFDKLRDDSKAEAWMMAITRNVASKFKDHQKVRRTVSIDEANETLLMADSGVNDVMGISFSEVSGLIDRLPEGYGRVFRLSVFEGLTHKEIATTLGIEPHSSSSQLARAKKMLRKMLRQYWAVLLVLLVPLALLLFRKEETPVEAGKTPETPSTTATGQPMHSQTATTQRPTPATNRPTPTTRSVCCGITATKPCTQQPPLPIAQSTDTTASDSLQHIAAQEQPPSSPCPTDSLLPQHRPEHHNQAARLFPDKTPTADEAGQEWSLQLAYAGQYDQQSRYHEPFVFKPLPQATQSQPEPDISPTIPDAIDNWADYAVYLANNMDAVSAEARSALMRIVMNNANRPGEDKILRTSHHRMPVTWSLALRHQPTRRFGWETGLSYSRLASDFEMGENENVISEQQTVHYVGIPVKGTYNVYDNRRWSLYGSLGMAVDIPVRAVLKTDYYVQGLFEATDRTTIHAPWQFSTTLGLGLQYHLTPTIGLFAEPSLLYYIPTKSHIETYRTEHPFSFSLPLGIRFSW